MIDVKLSDRVRNEVIREECGVKENVVTKFEKNMLRWFGHLERMDERILTKEIFRRIFLDQIGEVIEKGQVKSSRNWRVCMRKLMTVEEVKGKTPFTSSTQLSLKISIAFLCQCQNYMPLKFFVYSSKRFNGLFY
jgi:hypothetical protein